MHSRKSVRPRMELWGTPALTGYCCEDVPSRSTWSHLLLRKEDKAKYLNWNSIRFKFMKNISMPNPVKSLGYIKCYSSSSPWSVKSPSNSIRYNCQKVCSWSRRPKTILEIRKKTTFFADCKLITYKFFKDFSNRPSPTLLNTETTNETFQQSGKQESLRHILKSSVHI